MSDVPDGNTGLLPEMNTGEYGQPIPAAGLPGANGAHSNPSPRWGRTERMHLLTWVAIAFVAPAALLFGLHLANMSVLTVRRELSFEGIMVFFVSLATWIVSRLEKRPLADYGIPLRQAFGVRFWEGTVWGFVMLSAVLLALWASGDFRINSIALTAAAAYRSAAAWGLAFVFVGLNEELTFRGYLLFTLSRRMRFWPAALVISAAFACAHLPNHGENALGILQVFIVGLLFCLTIRRTGTLWFAIGFHAAWDWAQTFFYGTPDSGLLGVGRLLNSSVHGPGWLTGGSAGPEGSVVAVFVLLLCALLIHVRFPKAIYPDHPA